MATINENVQIIQDNVNQMKTKLSLPSTATIFEITEKTGNVEATLQEKTVTPSDTTTQEITPDTGYDGMKKVTVKKITSSMISSLAADKIKYGEEILGVVGTYGPTSQIKQVTPTKQGMTVYPDGDIEFLQKVVINPVTSAIDDNIAPANIKYGVEILGVEGAFEGDHKFQEKYITPSKNNAIDVVPDAGYTGMTKVTVGQVTAAIDYNIKPENIKKGVEIMDVYGTYEPAPSQTTKHVEPRTYEQTVRPDEGYGTLDQVTVGEVTAAIDSSIQPNNIRKGVTILEVEGTMEPTMSQNIIVTPKTTEQTFTPGGIYNAIHTVTVNPVTSDIDANIVASNIKTGVEILGVEGTFDGGSNLQIKEVTPTDEVQTVLADDGYDALSRVDVLATPVEDITITSSTDHQTIMRSEGKFINSVTVPKVTSSIDNNIKPENIKMNMSILGVVGTYDGDMNEYFASIPAGTSTSAPGLAKAIIGVPPTIAFSSTDGSYAFSGMTNLTRVPKIDYSKLTKMNYTFSGCTGMSDLYTFQIPASVQEAKYIFNNCRFPAGVYNYELPNITSLSYVFFGIKFANSSQTTFNIKISSKCTYLGGMFGNNSELNRVPAYLHFTSDEVTKPDASGLANANGDIVSLILDDNIKPTSIAGIGSYNSYYRNSNWNDITVNMDECTAANNMFDGSCTPRVMTFNGESRKLKTLYQAFYDDWYSDHRRIETINGQLYGDSLTNLTQAFFEQTKLVTFNGIKNLGKAYTQKTTHYGQYALNLGASSKLSYQSLINIINNLYDLNITYGVYDANGTPGTGTLYRQQLILGSTNLAKLTAEEKAIATNKGWDLS